MAYAFVKTVLTVILLLGSVQTSDKDSFFSVHVTKVQRVGQGCSAQIESGSLSFRVSSERSGTCAILRAGEGYRACRGTLGDEGTDRSKDVSVLLIQDNQKTSKPKIYPFQIDSEEVTKTN